MTSLLLHVFSLLLAVPCVYWTQSVESRARLEAAGIKRLCTEADLAKRETLPTPGITARAGLASPTRSPWIDANGWRFTRHPDARFVYNLPAGKAALAAAEAFAYGADAVLKIDPADLGSLGAMLTFLEGLPAADLPPAADLAVVDDGSDITGEVMNLLARRNLLFQVVQAPSPRFRINIAVGSTAYPREDAADPSAFALKIRRQLTDEERSLRVYGSEVVIARLTGDATRIRAHLLHSGGRHVEGPRPRPRGGYRKGQAYVAGGGRRPLEEHVVAEGSTEFSVPRITTYAVIDLEAVR